ncbi:MAG: phosphotransferase [Candidatus Gracilibacteria bacterium]|jgi:thiamine kinase-like enzyme|nr:phosphotransferase [Candidatus Gracilibacteria bacterium]
MEQIHTQNITFLKSLFEEQKFDWINKKQATVFSFFKSGGGTHLYLIENGNKKYLARINYYEPKNEWGVKKQEYDILKLIEPLKISPKAYYFSDKNTLKQDFTIVEYVEGQTLEKISEKNIIDLASDLRKLHTVFTFEKAGNKHPPQDDLPYHCDIYNEFANGEDKKIENYLSLEGINKIVEPYNRINKKLRNWFNNLQIFSGITKFCLCHADLKKENILITNSGITLIDWECAGSDIPETDIGRLFSGCEFTKKQQDIFLKTYYKGHPEKIVLQRIFAVKKVLDFFHILEDYILLKRKPRNSDNMLKELLKYEKNSF